MISRKIFENRWKSQDPEMSHKVSKIGSKWYPKWLQNGAKKEPKTGPKRVPKSAPKRIQKSSKTLCFPCVSAQNGGPRGPQKEPQNGPKTSPKWGQNYPQNGPKLTPKGPKSYQNGAKIYHFHGFSRLPIWRDLKNVSKFLSKNFSSNNLRFSNY